MNTKLWGGCYAVQTNHDVEQFTASIQFDAALAEEDILGSMAHANMLAHYGMISVDENQAMQAGLRDIAVKIAAGQIRFRVEDEDIHMNIERLLTESIGETAKKLHTARSRNDQVALDLHLYVRKHMLIIMRLLFDLNQTLLVLAEKHVLTIVPGYTHLQRAQPITLAQYFLAYVAMFQRDLMRLQEDFHRVNQSPLGAAALAGSSFAIDRQFVANELGFDGIYQSTLDAVSDRDFVVEFLAASSLIMMHVSRLSEELILWSSQEFGFIRFDEGYCTGSSIMPQKKNPDVAELGRGKTGRVYGALMAVLTVMKGLPLAYNKDMQEDKEPVFDVVKTLCQTLKIYAPMLATLHIDADRMLAATRKGYLNATLLAEYLVKKGMSFRSAHEVAGKLVAFCHQRGVALEDVSLAELSAFSQLFESDIHDVLSIPHAAFACISKTATQQKIDEARMANKKALVFLNEKESLLASVRRKYSISA